MTRVLARAVADLRVAEAAVSGSRWTTGDTLAAAVLGRGLGVAPLDLWARRLRLTAAFYAGRAAAGRTEGRSRRPPGQGRHCRGRGEAAGDRQPNVSAGPYLAALHRYPGRFGGVGTIVTLADGRAFTAAHCLAAVDGRRGVVIGNGRCAWRVLARWLPRRTDLAVLQVLDGARWARRGSRVPGWPTGRAVSLATRALVRPGRQVAFVGHVGRRFQTRLATVTVVSATSAIAVVEHRTGVCANDSGGPVFVDGVLMGIVTHRTGATLSCRCSSQLVFTRLEALGIRLRLRAVWGTAGL